MIEDIAKDDFADDEFGKAVGWIMMPVPESFRHVEAHNLPFVAFGWRFANIIIQADVALGNKPHYQSIRRYINNIEPLLLAYGKKILTLKGPDGWANVYKQIMSNLDPKTLPFALKDRNPEGIALLKLVEQIDFYDPVLDGLLSAFKYDRTYFGKLMSSLGLIKEQLPLHGSP